MCFRGHTWAPERRARGVLLVQVVRELVRVVGLQSSEASHRKEFVEHWHVSQHCRGLVILRPSSQERQMVVELFFDVERSRLACEMNVLMVAVHRLWSVVVEWHQVGLRTE